MRILIAHNFYQIPGGEDAVARSEIDMLRFFGEEVFTHERHNDELKKLNPLSQLAHFVSLSHNRRSYDEMREVLRKHRPQVVHVHNIYYMMTPSVYQACQDEGVPVVQSLHNYRMMCSNGLFYRDGHVCEDCVEKNIWEGVKHKCFRHSTVMTMMMASTLDRLWRAGVWIKNVDRYIVAAEFTRKKYTACGIPAEKIAYKPHFIHPDLGKRDCDDGYVLYLGRLSQEKGVDVLLESWRSVKDIPLKIAGIGDLEGKLKKFVFDHQLNNVEFLGFLNQSQCQDVLSKASALVIPSVCYENFPRVVVEAFSRGVPVIASRLGSLAELVEDGKTGLLVEPGDAAAIQRAVRKFFEDRNTMAAMGEEARRVFEQKYTAQTNYHQLIGIYGDVLEQRKAVH